MPNPLPFLPEMAAIAEPLHKVIANGVIPPATVSLLQLRAGQILGSTYFTIRETGNLRGIGESEERITALATWRDATCFTDAERVALELVEAVLTPNPSGERVPDEAVRQGVRALRRQGDVASRHGDRPYRLLRPRGSHRQADPRHAPGRNYSDPREAEA